MSKPAGFFKDLEDGNQVLLEDEDSALTLKATGMEMSFPYPECGYEETAGHARQIICGINEALALAGFQLQLTEVRDSGNDTPERRFQSWDKLLKAYGEYEPGPPSWDVFVLVFRKL